MMLKEQWMYKCEACECVKLLSMNHGDTYLTMCEPCNLLRFFCKVVARTDILLSRFYSEGVERKEEDDTKSDSK